MVLNGGIFALWAYRDVALALGDADANREFEEGVNMLAAQHRSLGDGYLDALRPLSPSGHQRRQLLSTTCSTSTRFAPWSLLLSART